MSKDKSKDKSKSKDIPKAVVKKAVKKVVAATKVVDTKKAAKPKKVKPTPRFYKQWGKGKKQWVSRRDGFSSLSIEHITDGEVNEIYILEKEIPFLIKALYDSLKKIAVAKALAKAGGKPFV